ncbi:hypothetical protein WR25_26514 isoform B [Diploscapter pachys]|uniref:Uncharacterized protein n=1 Tax=Diploscapter pachys TaxID=2018661 RepID=A0A2A2LIP4_9BILA|nr:hypothetical protein WR25_26514 isoform B [Diploscapter pachys]
MSPMQPEFVQKSTRHFIPGGSQSILRYGMETLLIVVQNLQQLSTEIGRLNVRLILSAILSFAMPDFGRAGIDLNVFADNPGNGLIVNRLLDDLKTVFDAPSLIGVLPPLAPDDPNAYPDGRAWVPAMNHEDDEERMHWVNNTAELRAFMLEAENLQAHPPEPRPRQSFGMLTLGVRDGSRSRSRSPSRAYRDDRKSAKVYSLIDYNLEDRKFFINDFQAYIPRGQKVIAFIGPSGSGKTTLIHNLALTLGYAIRQEHVLLSMASKGICLYVLRDDNMVILDICDSLESETSTDPNVGGALLEIFAYISCNNLIYTVPVNEDTNTSEIRNSIALKLCALFSASELLRVLGSSKITVLLRATSPSQALETTLNQYINEFHYVHEDIDIDQEIVLLRNHTVNLQQFRYYGDVFDTLNMEKHKKFSHHLKYQKIEVFREMFTFIESLKDTPTLFSFNVIMTLNDLWARVTSHGELNIALSAAANLTTAGHSQSVDNVNNFFSELNTFLATLNHQSPTIEAVVRFSKKARAQAWITAKHIRQGEASDEQRVLFMKTVNNLSAALLENALQEENDKHKQQGIILGLNGFLLFPKTGEPLLTHTSLKIAVCENNVISHLSHPEVYNHHSDCWILLTYIAKCGFKLPLLEFPALKAVEEMIQWSNPNDNQLVLQQHMLTFLSEMINIDTTRYLPQLFMNVDQMKVGRIPVMDIVDHYEEEVEGRIEILLEDALRESNMALPYSEVFLSMLNIWLNTSGFCEKVGLNSGNATPALQNELCLRHHSILARHITARYLSVILDGTSTFQPNPTKRTSIDKELARLWRNIADFSNAHPAYLDEILSHDTNIKVIELYVDKLIDEGIDRKPEDRNDDIGAEIMRTLTSFMEAEETNKHEEEFLECAKNLALRFQNGTPTDPELIQEIGFTRLMCIRKGIVTNTIARLCTLRINPEDVKVRGRGD